jgi:hypothetical protein
VVNVEDDDLHAALAFALCTAGREDDVEAGAVEKLGRSLAGGHGKTQSVVGEAQFVEAVLRTPELRQLAKVPQGLFLVPAPLLLVFAAPGAHALDLSGRCAYLSATHQRHLPARVLSVRPDGSVDLDIREGAQARLIAPPAERGNDARQLSLIASSRLAGPLDPEAWWAQWKPGFSPAEVVEAWASVRGAGGEPRVESTVADEFLAEALALGQVGLVPVVAQWASANVVRAGLRRHAFPLPRAAVDRAQEVDSEGARELCAAAIWSPSSHGAFDAMARGAAARLLLVGSRLHRSILPVWVEHAMPFLVERGKATW